jgi:phage tail sheath protein FI
MAERIVSPGVFTRENDLSFLAQGIGEIGAAFIGPFKQGPAFVPTIVRTQSEFADKFGTPDGTYYTEYAVQNYLREAGVATIVRVMNVGGYKQVDPIGLVASGSNGKKLVATLHSTEVGDVEVGFGAFTVSPSETTSGSFVVSGSGIGEVSSSLLPSATNDVRDVFGTSPLGGKDGYVYSYFENVASGFTYDGDAGVEALALADQDFEYDPTAATTPYVKSQLISGERYDLFRFHTLGHGNNENKRFKISISNVKAAGEDGGTDYSVFSVTVRAFSDTDKRKVVLETFNNVNLDPASPNFIGRVIGDRYMTIDSNGKITEYGDWINNSKYIRVEVAAQGSYPVSAAPFGHGAYTNPIYVGSDETLVPAVVYTSGSILNTAGAPTYFAGFDFETAGVKVDNHNYLNPIPASATVGANVDFGFDSSALGLSYIMSGSDSADMVKRQFTIAFQGGFDGQTPAKSKNLGTAISAGNSQGFDLSSSTASGSVAYTKAINAISNADEYDINMVATPGVIRRLHTSVATAVIDMVEARQDCFYIADFNAAGDTISQATTEATAVDTNYAATYYPWVKTVDTNTNKLISVPPSVLMPAVFASNDAIGAEWFAPAGLNRGGIVGAVSVLNRLTHSERDTLYENKVNPIAAFPGQGIVAFGQKTLQDRASALDRINVRRLLITVKKFVASTSRFLVFEQNTAQTRGRFINTVQPYLEGIQQRQGLYAFKVVMDESNNTPDVVDRNILAGQIFLQPAKTAEFIVIDFNILPTGASFSA